MLGRRSFHDSFPFSSPASMVNMANPNGEPRKEPNMPLMPDSDETATTGRGSLSRSASHVPRAPLPPVRGPSGPMEPPNRRPT
ncbi:hypothetical protein AOA80_03140, partial [Methanomassiliicoccales archaeon RumEn M1]